MNLTRFAVAAVLACGIAEVSRAQVLAPAEIKDPKLRALQSKYLSALTAAAAEIASHGYPSKFYLTRALDLRGSGLASADRRSVEFALFGKQTVLRVRGNYAAVYPSEMPPADRVSRTYLDVAVPILKSAIQPVKDETEMDAIVVELSHHVRKMAVVTVDRFENSTFVLPRNTARKIAETSDPNQQLAALTEATVYIDGRIVSFAGPAKAPPALIGSAAAGAQTAASSLHSAAAPVLAAAPDRRQMELQPVLEELVLANHILANEGVLDGYGHVSVRSPGNPNHFFLARAGAPALVTIADITEYDLDSNPVTNPSATGYTERFIHSEIYKARPDVMAVVHCHCPEVIPFADTAVPLQPMHHMGSFIGGGVPVFEIRNAGGETDMLIRTPALGRALAQTLDDKSAVLMRGHGAAIVASALHVVAGRAYYLNLNARLQLQALQLGGRVTYLDSEESKKAVIDYERSWDSWKHNLAAK